MYRIDSSGSVGVKPTPAALGTEGFWSAGDPSVPTPATEIDQDFMNMLQESLIAPIDAFGIAHSKTDVSQLLQAMFRVTGLRGVTGSAAGGTKTASINWNGNAYSFNGATTGAGGWQDSSAYPTGIADISLYLGWNPTTVTWVLFGLLGSTSNAEVYTGGRLPSGCVFGVLASSVKTDGSGNILPFVQVGRRIAVEAVAFISGGTATSLTVINIASIVPANAKTVSGYFDVGVGTAITAALASASNGAGLVEVSWNGTSGSIITPFPDVALFTPQSIYYEVFNSSYALTAAITGYSF